MAILRLMDHELICDVVYGQYILLIKLTENDMFMHTKTITTSIPEHV